MLRKIIIDTICFLFILLFIYAAISKLMDYKSFSIQVGFSPLLRNFGFEKTWGIWIAWIIPASEIFISFLLMTNRNQIIGLSLSTGIMISFTLYIIYVLVFAPYVPCLCGGILNELGWVEHIYFNCTFIVLGILGIVLYKQDFKLKKSKHSLT